MLLGEEPATFDSEENSEETKKKLTRDSLASSVPQCTDPKFASIGKDYPNKETEISEYPQEATSITPKPSLPVAMRVGSQRNILILGRAEAGKYTIAKYIATDDNQNFPKQDTKEDIRLVHHYELDHYNFVTIDTAGVHLKHHANEQLPSFRSVKLDIERYLEHGIHLILVVVRRDCCSLEDINFLVVTINNLFSQEARKYIALVHTGCEILEDPQRKTHIETFAKSEGPAENLSSLCEKGIFSVGFPDLNKVDKKYFQLFNESVIKGKQDLRKLVKDSKYIQPYAKLLKTGYSYSSDQLFPSSNPSRRCKLM